MSGVSLIGFRRAGKSGIGRRLAAKLGRLFIDLDEAFELHIGCAPADAILHEGEAAFRQMEARTLEKVVGTSSDAILSTGGGTPLLPPNRDRLRSYGRIIYLHVAEEELVRRAERDPGIDRRPRLAGNSAGEEVRILWPVREPIYRELATWIVESKGKPADIVARCAELILRDEAVRPKSP